MFVKTSEFWALLTTAGLPLQLCPGRTPGGGPRRPLGGPSRLAPPRRAYVGYGDDIQECPGWDPARASSLSQL